MKEVSIVSIPVTDQQKAKEFYLHLGFVIMVEAPMGPGQTWVQMKLPDTQTSIALVTWFPDMPVGSLRGFVITVDNIDTEVEALTAKGIKVEPIDKTPWGRFAAIIDPDGNRVSIHSL